MPRNRVTYQSEAAFIGPALISGNVGGIIGTYYPEPLERVTSLDYSIDLKRADIVQLGVEGLTSRPVIPHPTVDFKISYHLASFRNEKEFNFAFNYQEGEDGTPLYTSNYTQSLTAYFVSDTNRGGDRRNLYVAIAEEGNDVVGNQDAVTGVVGFSKCYLTHYSSQGSVGDFISNSAGFTACDMQYFDIPDVPASVDMPVINFKDIKNLDTLPIVLPEYTTTGVSILHPRDITVTIEKSDGGTPENLMINVYDAKVQDYSLDLSINRQPLEGIGFKMPIDYAITPPSVVTLSINALVGDQEIGSLRNMVDQDDEYDVYLDMRGFVDCDGSPELKIKNRYIIKKAKLERANFTSSIGSNKTVQLGFATEIDIDDLSKGLFLSGQINV